MKKTLYFALAFVAMMGFVACGDDSSDDKKGSGNDTPAEKTDSTWSTTRSEKIVPATEFADTLSLYGLKGTATVADYNARESWAQLIALPTADSQPSLVVLACQPNPQSEDREMTFTITDKTNNKYYLKVIQQGKTSDGGDSGEGTEQEDIDKNTNTNVDTPNDQESDQPAFGRR